MGCFSSRQKIKIEEGICCEEGYPTHYSKFSIFILIKDPIVEKLLQKKVEFFQDYQILLRFQEFMRSTDFCLVTKSGLLFEFQISFDLIHMKKSMEDPFEVSITFNEMFNGNVLLPKMKSSIFFLSKKEIVFNNLKGQEISLTLFYGWTGEYFEKIRSFSHEYFSSQEQFDIITQTLKLENDDFQDLNIPLKRMLDPVVNNKDFIYNNLITIPNPGENAFTLLETLFRNYNPYSFGLYSSFKLFMKNIVRFTEKFDSFAVELITSNYDEFLIYENVESLKVMMKEMFKTSKDPEGYFTKYAQRNSDSNLIKEIFQSVWLFDSFILPLFNKDVLTAINLCSILDKFEGFEDYFLQNSPKLSHLNFDQLFLENEHARLINLLKTPEFHNIKLKVLDILGHGEPTLSPFLGCQNIQAMVDGKTFSTNKGENKNIAIIAEQIDQKTIFATHVYLYGPGSLYNSPLIKAAFFLSEIKPDQQELSKFSEMKFEDFLNKDYQKDENLIYCGTIDLADGGKQINHDYKEIYFEKVITGKYLTVLCLETPEKAMNMDIGKLGCLGFISEEASLKYNMRIFRNGKIRVRNKIINYLDTFKKNQN